MAGPKIRSSGAKLCCFFLFLCFLAIPLSEDHKPNRRDERERIENAGGVVMWAGNFFVSYNLINTRGKNKKNLNIICYN